MPEVTKYTPGAFCWVELATTDAAAALSFYKPLFGWTTSDIPMGEMGTYHMLQKDGKEVGAAYTMMPEQQQQGIPPNWMSYVATDSADDAAKKAQSLGGTVVAGPMDVFEEGRMAIISDPTGAVFAVWQPKKHIGSRLLRDPGAPCWNEILTPDMERAKSFYTQLFGWTAKTSQDANMPYTEWHDGAEARGGGMEMKDMPPCWLPYFSVTDTDATAKQIESLGGRVLMPPQDIPNVGRFAFAADPQGAHFYVIRLDAR